MTDAERELALDRCAFEANREMFGEEAARKYAADHFGPEYAEAIFAYRLPAYRMPPVNDRSSYVRAVVVPVTELAHIAQMVHQAHHGTDSVHVPDVWETCDRATCARIRHVINTATRVS